MLTTEEVKKIAKLARLELTEAEIEKYRKDLSAILEYADKLKELDTEGVKPLYQVTGLEHVVRNDEVKTQDDKILEKLVEASGQGERDNMYLVKNVL